MVSIVIPVYNQHSMTRECLEAIRANTAGDYEIVIVDNGSDPPIDGATVRNATNLGFPVAVNQGIREAKGDIIILLNNDVVVTWGWMGHLCDRLKDFAVVGPLTNYAAGIQQVRVPVYKDEKGLNREAHKRHVDHAGETDEVNWVIGFCMAFNKSLWEEIGPFDESMWPCSGEEIDFCKRARDKGYRIAVAQDVYVHHHGTRTFRDLENAKKIESYEYICAKCDDHLRERWGEEIFKQSVDEVGTTLSGGLRLNLGCGYAHVKKPGWVNIDNREECGPDLLCDILDGLPYASRSVDEVYAADFLEHIPIGKTIQVITEIWRVLKPGGIFISLTPSTDGRGAFQDPTHVSFWNANSWYYYSEKAYRDLYGIMADFEIVELRDTVPDPRLKIIHTYVKAKARKVF